MIDHLSIGVRDLRRSVRFYEAALAPQGTMRLVTLPHRVGLGAKYPELWLNERPKMVPVSEETGAHLCLRARSRDAIDAFYGIALDNGRLGDGAPGLRQAAQVIYYAAFIREPDGNQIEVMTVPTSD